MMTTADAALVVEETEVSVFQGTPPKRRKIGLPHPVVEVCSAERTLYWIDAEGQRLWRTRLSTTLEPVGTELVMDKGQPRKVTCAGNFVGWSSTTAGQTIVHMLQYGASVATGTQCF